MSLIYTKTNRIRFTDISDKYKVNKSVKGKLSELHALLITHVSSNFKDTRKYKQGVVDALNLITYAVYADEPLPFNWSPNKPFDNMPQIDEDLVKETLADIFLTIEGIEWDVKPNYSQVSDFTVATKEIEAPTTIKKSPNVKPVVSSTPPATSEVAVTLTPKQDLYIQPPNIPQFDCNTVWMSGIDGADNLVIYATLPEIPTRQNEISCTTDVSRFTYAELMNLFPNQLIHTRASIMYESIDGVELDPDLGLIIPVEGYTREQLIANVVKYPHFYKLTRLVDGRFSSFYSNIELDGKLYDTLEVWDQLPESKILPKQAEFVKEYVVRRYLLERDVKRVKHNYPMFGTLNPFLTLFMPRSDYIRLGYTDVEDIARQCVTSRVSYKQSRNPVIRRLTANAELHI